MAEMIAVLGRALWALRHAVEAASGRVPVQAGPLLPRGVSAVAGPGVGAAARRGRALAERRGLPYLAVEPGPLGVAATDERIVPCSVVFDWQRHAFDGSAGSDYEAKALAATDRDDGIFAAFVERRLSDRTGIRPGVQRGAASAVVFDDPVVRAAPGLERLLDRAVERHGGGGVTVATSGGPLGAAARRRGIRVLEGPADPWDLLSGATHVYAGSDPAGFLALLAGLSVTTAGRPFFAGWGLTEDLDPVPSRQPRPLSAVSAALAAQTVFVDPWFSEPLPFAEAAAAVEAIVSARRRVDRPMVTVGLSGWKRGVVAPFLAGDAGPPLHERTLPAAIGTARRTGGVVAIWGADAAVPDGVDHVRVEDGFIRSVGLGLLREPPASLVVDGSGLYMDARGASDFERLAQASRFPAELVARAAAVRERMVALGLTKYNPGRGQPLPDIGGKLRILVPGQVESDASIRFGSPVVRTNADLLRAVRARHPDAFVAYKPHPDVVTGLRPGKVPPEALARDADLEITDTDIVSCLTWCDRVETMTSLAGFEALIRGKAVTVHGAPFYAGWGLTEDLVALPRRTRRLTLDELVAVTFLLYPRYADPLSGLPATVEVVMRRLADLAGAPPTVRRRAVGLYRRLLSTAIHRLLTPLEHRRSETGAGRRPPDPPGPGAVSM